MRDITLGITFYHDFTTRAFATGIPTQLAGSPVLSVLEENNATPITAGVSVSVDRASVTGLNEATIVATSGNGYEAGKSYSIYISTGTVGGVSVVGEVVGQFTVGQSAAAVDLANGTDGLGAIKAETATIVADTADMQPLIEKMAYVGSHGLGVWIDDGAANENTVLGTDGTPDNPVSTIAAATTVASSLGSQRFYLVNDTQITLAQTYEGYDFIGVGIMNQVTLGSQDVDNSHFENLILTGTQGGTQFLLAVKCQLQALLSMEIIARDSELTGDITLRVATNQTFINCSSATPGGGTPDLTFPGAGGATTVNWRNYSGGLTVKSARLNDVMSYETDGQIVIDATCTSLEIHVRGNCSITDNGTTTILTKDAAINAVNIGDSVWDEARSGHATQGTYGEQMISVISFTVDTVTNTHTPTTTEFQADDITEATADHFNGRIVIWRTGVLAGQATDITDYAAVGGIGQFTVTAMTEAPSNNDTGIIV